MEDDGKPKMRGPPRDRTAARVRRLPIRPLHRCLHAPPG
jgi:hypothetical protein